MRIVMCLFCFFFSSRRRHTRLQGDWSSDVCSSDLRCQDIGDRLADPGSAVAWLASAISGLPEAAARQLVDYLDASKKILGVIPTQQTLVLERFFDEAGGMQLVLHAPFGSRVNRAWGLALRKRFCRSFNFELQAAATED